MPEEKIKILEEKQIHLWFEGSPVVLCSSKLALDIDKAEIFASAKWMNLQPDNLNNVTFDILCYDVQRQLIDQITNIEYNGFDVSRNTEFGYNRRITIPNAQTRSVEFVLKTVTNSIGDHWVNHNELKFDTSLEQQSIFTVQGNLNKQFLEICTRANIDGTRFSFQPIFTESHWICGCGCFNWITEEECFNCGVGKSWLERNCKEEVLQKQSNFEEEQRAQFQQTQHTFTPNAEDNNMEREEFQKRQKEYQKQLKKQKHKKHLKTLSLIILILLVIAAICYGIFGYGLPYLKYSSAVSDFESYRFDDAITKFTELGDFMESEEFRLKSTYGKALSLVGYGDPEQAAELFQSLEPYSDSHEQYLAAEFKLAEKKYYDGEYLESAKIFHSLGEYNNAPANEKQCFRMLYQEAQTYLLTNTIESLETAYEELSYIGKYKKSLEMLDDCLSRLGNLYYAQHQYKTAIEKYRLIQNTEISKDISTLSDLISSADENSPALWLSDGLPCKICQKQNAVYSLELGQDGHYSFSAKCSDDDEEIFSQSGIFKIENNTIDYLNSDNQWETFLKITSIKPDETVEGKNTVLSLNIVKPYDNNVASLQLYGNILSNDTIAVQ